MIIAPPNSNGGAESPFIDATETRKQPIEVSTGEVKIATSGVLRASALGSCVAVALYEVAMKVGGIAHVMLPGRSPGAHGTDSKRYVEDGIQELLDFLLTLGARSERLIACIAGAGNVLNRADDTICEANYNSVVQVLEKQEIALAASHVGGNQRRSMSLHLDCGRVSFSVGDSGEETLWACTDEQRTGATYHERHGN